LQLAPIDSEMTGCSASPSPCANGRIITTDENRSCYHFVTAARRRGSDCLHGSVAHLPVITVPPNALAPLPRPVVPEQQVRGGRNRDGREMRVGPRRHLAMGGGAVKCQPPSAPMSSIMTYSHSCD
jgi:hypothetical protein